jgi:glycerophosphoryl diester phosphodiesterase
MGMRPPAVAALLLGSGCGPPLAEVAWRGGDAHWPANSPAALAESLDAGVDLHLQLWLAGDRQPVVWGAPTLDAETCETVGGRDIDEEVWLVEQPADVLIAGWRCGARAAADRPEAATAPFPLMTLEQLLDQLALHEAAAEAAGERPAALTLELGFFVNVSHEPEVIAAELVERWRAAGRVDGLRVLSAEPAVLRAVQARADGAGVAVERWLRWPTVPPLAGEGAWSAGAQLGQALGLVSATRRAEDLGVDGISLPVEAADRAGLDAAAAAGLQVQIGPLDDADEARALRRWAVDSALVRAPRVGG